LDSGSGTLGSEQLQWFKNLLENQRQIYRHCILYTHNNLFRFRRTFSTNPKIEEIQVLLDLFTRHQVDMVVGGHDHFRDETVFGNTTYIIMDAFLDRSNHASYFHLQQKNGKLQYEFVPINTK
jgi:3',5'-cyclic AMP phosphodiesterase CpdA